MQEEAHSVFARAAIQRDSLSVGGLSRGGSKSLLNLLAADLEERSVRNGYGNGSVRSGSRGRSSSGASSPEGSYRPNRSVRMGQQFFSEPPAVIFEGVSVPAAGPAAAAAAPGAATAGAPDLRRVSYQAGNVSGSETLRAGQPLGGSGGSRHGTAVPLKSALRKSRSGSGSGTFGGGSAGGGGGSGQVVTELTALQASRSERVVSEA